ncbi:hypothetical protein M1446_00010 [Candidatus Dependentiae bacterium]|nr:hypothetical protein [Candidatus Dependentiae bacterium]
MKTKYILTLILSTILSANCMQQMSTDWPTLNEAIRSKPLPIRIGKDKKNLQIRVVEAIKNNNFEEIEILLNELNSKKEVCTYKEDVQWLDENIEKLNNKFKELDAESEESENESSDETPELTYEEEEETVGGYADEETSQEEQTVDYSAVVQEDDSQEEEVMPLLIDNSQSLAGSQYSITQVRDADFIPAIDFNEPDLTQSVLLFNQIQSATRQLKELKESEVIESEKRIENLKKQLDEEVKRLAKNKEEQEKVKKQLESLTKKDDVKKITTEEVKQEVKNSNCALV